MVGNAIGNAVSALVVALNTNSSLKDLNISGFDSLEGLLRSRHEDGECGHDSAC